MKINSTLFTALFLVVFIVTALFGFAVMNHSVQHMPDDCILGVFGSTACPQNNIFTMSLHHIGAYQSFSNGVNIFSLVTLLSVLIIFASLFFTFTVVQAGLYPVRIFSRYNEATYASSRAQNDTFHWLKQLNNSPSTIH